MMRWWMNRFAASLRLVAGLALANAPGANAAYVVDVTQDGSNVVATGTGSLDLSGLSFLSNEGFTAVGGLDALLGLIEIGTSPGVATYQGVSGPGANSFMSSGNANPDASTGPFVGIQETQVGFLEVPAGYISGQSLGTSTATFDNTTIAGLNLIPGTYTWSWSGDSFTLDIPAASAPLPEPTTLVLLGVGLAGFVASRRRVCS